MSNHDDCELVLTPPRKQMPARASSPSRPIWLVLYAEGLVGCCYWAAPERLFCTVLHCGLPESGGAVPGLAGAHGGSVVASPGSRRSRDLSQESGSGAMRATPNAMITHLV